MPGGPLKEVFYGPGPKWWGKFGREGSPITGPWFPPREDKGDHVPWVLRFPVGSQLADRVYEDGTVRPSWWSRDGYTDRVQDLQTSDIQEEIDKGVFLPLPFNPF